MLNSDYRFDIDLEYGQIGENLLASCFSGDAKIEVKTEREIWKKTGNICIEYESRGKKSGILSTQATLWFHLLADQGGNIQGGFMFDKSRLLSWLVANKESLRKTVGGDNNTSKLLLVPISRLHEIAKVVL